jgi:photosynthetic reaction center H subunit
MITDYFDVAQMVLYLFWIFFFSLIIYLQRESNREGLPLVSETGGEIFSEGFFGMPEPKTFRLAHGESVLAPPGAGEDSREHNMEKVYPAPGYPWTPSGDPLVDGVGPAAWAMRSTHPDLSTDGKPKIVPLRIAADFSVAEEDEDPRGMSVVAACGNVAGTVTDVWVDRAESYARYFEVEPTAGGGRVLLPIPFTTISKGTVRVVSIRADQFARVPRTAHPDQVSLREEDQISGYFGGGHLYAFESRLGPLI